MRARLGKLLGCLATRSYRRALLRGVAAGVEHEPVLRTLACRSVVDIGANRGQFALVARHCFPEARIISFEPLAGPVGVFRDLFKADPRVRVDQAAIGPKAGEAAIHVSRRDDSSSLLPIAALQAQVFPGTDEVGTLQVRVGPLQDFVTAADLEAPALLKLDVQGYELEALRGCEGLLGHFAYVYVECSYVELYRGQALAGEVVEWLAERGFRQTKVANLSADRTGKPIQADFLFER